MSTATRIDSYERSWRELYVASSGMVHSGGAPSRVAGKRLATSTAGAGADAAPDQELKITDDQADL